LKKPPLITPSAFFSTHTEKIKINWFLYEYAEEIESKIKKPLRAKLKAKKIGNKEIASFCIHYAKHMKSEILDKLSGKSERVAFSYAPIEEAFPFLSDKIVDNLLTLVADPWESLTSICVSCPTRCICEKDQKAPMFDDPFYYE
jgi:hypothetical protein